MNAELFDEIFGKKSEEENYYEIIGCDPSATREQILAEYRAKVLHLHPDKGSKDTKEFMLLHKAREVLTSSKKRHDYDRWRNSGFSVSYKRWTQMNKKGSFHWVSSKKNSKPAIENGSESSSNQAASPPVHWERSEKGKDSMLERFRNYEI